MGSVRDRVERQLKEAPEVVMPTPVRRTALTSNPTMSTRTAADFAASQNEVTVRSTERTSAASCDFGNGDGFSRTRDRQAAVEATKPEAARPKTQAEIDAEGWYEYEMNRIRRQEQDEQARIAAQQKRQADERAAADARRQAEAARQRKAQYAFAENAVLHECSDLTPAEQQMFWEKLVAMNSCLDVSAAAIVAEAIRLGRK